MVGRPKMQVKPDDAEFLYLDVDMRFSGHGREFLKSGVKMFEAKEALEKVDCHRRPATHEEKTALAEMLHEWLVTYVSDDGWTRMLATRRQQTAKAKSKLTHVPMSRTAARNFAHLAKKLGVDRRKVFETLGEWITTFEGSRAVNLAYAQAQSAQSALSASDAPPSTSGRRAI